MTPRVSIRRILIATAAVLALPCALALFGYQDGRAIERKNAKARELEVLAQRLDHLRPSMSSVLETLGQPSHIKPELQDWSTSPPSTADEGRRQVLYLTWEYGFRPLPWQRPYVASLTVRFTVVHSVLTYTGAHADAVWY